jgi:hypothetical protein
MTSSGSHASVKALNPRKSQNSAVTSRRWLSKGESGASEEAIICATCGAKNCCKRPIRSICASCSATRSSSNRFQLESSSVCCFQLSRLQLRGIVQFLDAEQGADAGHQCGLLEWLGDVVIAPCLETIDDVAGVGFGRHQDDGYEAKRNIRLDSSR